MKFIWYLLDVSHGRLLSTWEGDSAEEPPLEAVQALNARASGVSALAVGRFFRQP